MNTYSSTNVFRPAKNRSRVRASVFSAFFLSSVIEAGNQKVVNSEIDRIKKRKEEKNRKGK